jgi:hypothetical protein
MGVYIRPSRFLTVRITRCGVRWAFGLRWLGCTSAQAGQA